MELIEFGDGTVDVRPSDTETTARFYGNDAKSNAQLFCSAPDLLEACKNVLEVIDESEEWWMDCPDKGGFDRDKIENVINKAEGKC
jgi:hypothetical protein